MRCTYHAMNLPRWNYGTMNLPCDEFTALNLSTMNLPRWIYSDPRQSIVQNTMLRLLMERGIFSSWCIQSCLGFEYHSTIWTDFTICPSSFSRLLMKRSMSFNIISINKLFLSFVTKSRTKDISKCDFTNTVDKQRNIPIHSVIFESLQHKI